MNTAQESMARIGNAVATIAAVAAPAPMPGFLSRFVPAAERLDPVERQRLMTETADSIRRSYTGQDIDWQAVDTINRQIGETFTRNELVPLLDQYKATIGSPPERTGRP